MADNAINIRVGNVINLRGGKYRVLKTMHTQPGKGGAFIQMELKEIKNGTKVNERFRSEEGVEKVQMETREAVFMYDTGTGIEIMYSDSYEQATLEYNAFGDAKVFLADGMALEVELADDIVISVRLPLKVAVKIAETESYIKGQTQSSSFKPAILENGIRISVPPFINAEEEVYVNPETLEYIEKVKK